jgi:hypothetical protein
MAIEIGEGKGINVRRENREQLLSIRRGEYDYDQLVAEAEEKIKKMDEVFENATLPEKIEHEFVNNLLLKMRKVRNIETLLERAGTFGIPNDNDVAIALSE